MRFSLGTFILLILLLSSIYATVMLNKPWYDAGTRGISQLEFNAMHFTNVSPDGTRKVDWRNRLHIPYSFSVTDPEDNFIGIFENKPDGKLLHPLTVELAILVNYESELEIELVSYAPIESRESNLNVIYRVHSFRRRYADSIWGHATRPEALVGVICLALLLWIMVRNLSRKQLGK